MLGKIEAAASNIEFTVLENEQESLALMIQNIEKQVIEAEQFD